jgi:hypothetical protein
LGFRLLIPRGQLDISYRDFFAARRAAQYITTARRYRYQRQRLQVSGKTLRVDPVLLVYPSVVVDLYR